MEYRVNRAGKPKLEDGKLSGRAAPFESETQIGSDKWGFKEKIARGAFKKSINDGDVVLLDNHDTAKPIARTSAGTLKLAETRDGLDWDAKPANTSYANDAVENSRAGNYGGCSFGFEVIRDAWTDDKGQPASPHDGTHRTLEEVKLHEISVVTFPAYKDTSVSARSAIANARGIDESEMDNERATAPVPKTAPYGNVAYADPKNKKYPVDTKAHAKAAWAYINMPKNAAKYPLNGVTLASVKAKIMAACKKFGIETNADEFTDVEIRDIVRDAMELLNEGEAESALQLLSMVSREADDTDAYADEFYEREDEQLDDAEDADAEDSDEENASKPSAGMKKCSECKGHKEVPNKSGGMHPCPTCKGKGEVKRAEETSEDIETRDSQPDTSTGDEDEDAPRDDFAERMAALKDRQRRERFASLKK
jgi:HK97 family phage prohead protease